MKNILLLFAFVTTLSAGIVPDTWYEILEFKPIKYGIMENRHLPGHVFWVATAGSASKRVVIPVLEKINIELRPETVEKWAIIGMGVFEGYQLIENKFEPASVYGSNERWFYDSVGDVVAPWWVLRKILYADKPLVVLGRCTIDGAWKDCLTIDISWRL